MANMKAKKQPCKCHNRTFPHRRDRHCEQYEWQASLARRDDAIGAETYRTEFERLSDEAGIPMYGEI